MTSVKRDRTVGQMEAPGEGHAEGGKPLLADAVSCRGVSKAYLSRAKQSSPFVALSDVDLMVGDGEFLTILGPSGCGKSTLLNIMAGIDQPTRGSVTFSDRIRRKAYLFQRDTLLPWRSALRNVEIGLTAPGGRGSICESNSSLEPRATVGCGRASEGTRWFLGCAPGRTSRRRNARHPCRIRRAGHSHSGADRDTS